MSPKKTATKTLVLLDAHAILHRAYHAIPGFTSGKGEPTGALYGLSLMLFKIVDELKPDYITACFDLPEKTFRHEAYEAYKAKRLKLPEDLATQINRSREIFKCFNIPIYDSKGFEADDILGTIVSQTKKNKGLKIIIASGDMDTMQLIDKGRVRVYTLRKGVKDTVIYDEAAVKERFGFAPEYLTDYKGLRGDPSDNIIGIKGIGDKTAKELVSRFGTIENIYKTLKKDRRRLREAGISERAIKLLSVSEEEALFSKELATIRRDAPVEFILPKESWLQGIDIENLRSVFTELGFRSLLPRAADIENLKKPRQKDLNKETDSPKELESSHGVQNSFPASTDSSPVINDPQTKKTALALWVLDSNFTNPTPDDILIFSKTDSLEEAKKYLLQEIERQGLMKVYRDIELPLASVVDKMERRGVMINTKYLQGLSKKYHEELRGKEEIIWKEAGEKFNINSPKQLAEVLFDRLALETKKVKKTPGGARSTRESELVKLRGSHPVIDHILEYRELQKLLSTYIDTIPDLVDKNNRLHASFSQSGTTTGRMSSQNPNLQNIPIKTERGAKIRNAFIASPGFKLAAFDYSQIELRVAAFLSKDEKLIKIFQRGEDVHTAVAAEVFNVSKDKVDREMRRRAKVINFGIIYGMGVNALREELEGSREEAQRFYQNYFESFPILAEYLRSLKINASKKGYTETFFGRRRMLPGLHSSIPYIRSAAERAALNAPIQGTQADIIKLAMSRIDRDIEKRGWQNKVYLLLQVHDELVYEIEEYLVPEAVTVIKNIMETILTLKDTNGVPLPVNIAVGPNWGELSSADVS